MSQLDLAIADAAEHANPEFAATARRIRAAGGSKREVVGRVKSGVAGRSSFVQAALLTLVDKIWAEESVAG